MDKNKSQIILLDENGLDTVAKALSSGCWTLTDAGSLDLSGGIETPSTSGGHGSAPQLTLAQGNVRPVTQVSATGGSANTANAPIPSVSEQPKVVVRDSLHLTTITELGKRLVAAAKGGNVALVRKLMAVGAPFISDGPIGMTPLHFAAQNGHYEICERLLCAGLNKDARNKVEKTALHLAAMEGHADIVSLLVMSEADINACDMLKMSPLHWACDRGHMAVARLLLRHNAKTEIPNKFHKTPLHLAVENGHKHIISLLQGGLSLDEGEDAVAVDSISLDMIHDPVVCKTEEVCTEEEQEYEEEVIVKHRVRDPLKREEEETMSNFDNDLQHSIITDDDADDQNTSVLATLAELAEATSRSGGCVDMSSVAALELLKAQAALMPIDDSSALVTSAVAHGQTLQLTEAGRQALKLIKQEPLLLPTSPLPQDPVEEIDTQSCAASPCGSTLSQTQSDSTSTSGCLPALLTSSAEAKSVEEEAEECGSEEVMQVITLSPEQYAALTGGKNGPIILQVMPSDGEGMMSELDQPLPKRQKIMQLITKTGQASLNQGQAIARVTGEVLSVDLTGTSTL
ncbi:GA-binding protein subunit beta-1-like [Palaemon carinicauda]|uniref:GA-binding protein subunit beta-1-like n=1 Tax=Palaemon carinicauda TaxID=392227 RepID=UPI0035B6830F